MFGQSLLTVSESLDSSEYMKMLKELQKNSNISASVLTLAMSLELDSLKLKKHQM